MNIAFSKPREPGEDPRMYYTLEGVSNYELSANEPSPLVESSAKDTGALDTLVG
jgi:hypothetical protein